MDALRALQAGFPPDEFWSPQVVGQVPEAAVDAFLDAMVARKPAQRERLQAAREIRHKSTMYRIECMNARLKGASKDESLLRGLAWAARLPWEVVEGIDYYRATEGTLFLPPGRKIWLPEGLFVWKLDANWSQLETIPEGTVVGGVAKLAQCKVKSLPAGFHPRELTAAGSALESLPEGYTNAAFVSLSKCGGIRSLPAGLRVPLLRLDGTSITELPSDLEVEGYIYIAGTALERLSDDEIRAMAPGVTGRIVR